LGFVLVTTPGVRTGSGRETGPVTVTWALAIATPVETLVEVVAAPVAGQ
jgi:hypothetical protein